MGICDLVPGISGGTIAFITGIYEELMETLTHLTPRNFMKGSKALFSFDLKKIQEFSKEINLIFLILLSLGISSAIILGSKIIEFLLINYNMYLFSFFVGLIIASTKIIYDKLDRKTAKEIIFGSIGFIVGVSFIFLTPTNLIEPNLIYLFFGGFIAISAMFLPGISGSYLLLILGLYEYVISTLNNLGENITSMIIFGVGIVAGILTIPRGINYLFKHYKSKTLSFLIGLVVGSLSVPLNNVFSQSPIGIEILFVLILIVFGGLVVLLAERLVR